MDEAVDLDSGDHSAVLSSVTDFLSGLCSPSIERESYNFPISQGCFENKVINNCETFRCYGDEAIYKYLGRNFGSPYTGML